MQYNDIRHTSKVYNSINEYMVKEFNDRKCYICGQWVNPLDALMCDAGWSHRVCNDKNKLEKLGFRVLGKFK
jgi:hypothetical protein